MSVELAANIIIVAVTVLIALFLLPFSCYYTYEYWLYRKHTVLIKRYNNLSFLQIIALLALLFHSVFVCTWELIFELPTNVWQEILVDIPLFTLEWVFLWISVLRYWHLWFDINCSIASMTHEWHKIIAPPRQKRQMTKKTSATNQDSLSHPSSTKIDWFIEHKSSLGNIHYTFPRLIIFFVFDLVMATMASILWDFIHLSKTDEIILIILSLMGYTIGLVLLAILYYQMSHKLKFQDNFFIGFEVKWLFRITAFDIFLFTLMSVPDDIMPQWKWGRELSIWFYSGVLVYSIVVSMTILVLTKHVLKRIEPLLNDPKFFDKHSKSRSTYATFST